MPHLNLKSPHAVLAIVIGAALQVTLAVIEPNLPALNLVALILLSFGYWTFLEAMGLEKPLNKLAATVYAMAFIALVLLALGIGDQTSTVLLYMLSALGVVLLTSAAFAHRPGRLKKTRARGAGHWVGARCFLLR